MDNRSKVFLMVCAILLLSLFLLYGYGHKMEQWKKEYVKEHIRGKVTDYIISDDLTIRWVPHNPGLYIYTPEGTIWIDLSKMEEPKNVRVR